MEAHELALTALRAVAVYVVMLAVIPMLGKRTVGNFTAFDLLVALMLGEVVDEIIYGDVTMAQGAVAILVVAAAQYSNSWLSYWDHGMDRVLEGQPTPIVRDGVLLRDGLRQERMNEKDALAEPRLEGIEDLAEVRLAQVEVDGQVSVLRQDWASPAQKADVFDEAKRERARATLRSRRPRVHHAGRGLRWSCTGSPSARSSRSWCCSRCCAPRGSEPSRRAPRSISCSRWCSAT